jgi:hypothetical protein
MSSDAAIFAEVPECLAPRENGGYGLILHLDLSWRRDRAIGGSSAARMEPDKKFARSDKNEADSCACPCLPS